MTKLYRSRSDKKLLGLCGGIAQAYNIDPTLLRLVVVVTAFFSGGAVILLYLVASIVIPVEPAYGGEHGYRMNDPFHDFSQFNRQQTKSEQAGPAFTAYETTSDPQKTDLDEMVKDLETKALRKEIEELRAKVAELEKGDK